MTKHFLLYQFENEIIFVARDLETERDKIVMTQTAKCNIVWMRYFTQIIFTLNWKYFL